ncbi:MAG: hypothetical protein KAJ40_02220 [Alphaproteobacteria bacterium]|nr:hypothetical protein [Alphaproteobacteria bacterium]
MENANSSSDDVRYDKQKNQHYSKEMKGPSSSYHYTVITEKTLFDVLGEIWRAKYIMAGFSILAALLAFVFMSISQRYYQAEMIVAPANPLGMMTISGAEQGMEGTMNANVSATRQGGDAFTIFEAIYNGASVASFLAKDEAFLKKLGEDRWNIFSEAKTNWDAQTISDYLSRHVHIEPVNGMSSLRRLSYMHPDKKFASELLGRIHRIADEIIRARILVQTNQRITYLNKALAKTNNPDHKRSLARLLMEQERLKMMVSLNQAYAASIVEPAYVSVRTCWPDPYVIYAVFILVSMVIGYIVATVLTRRTA